MNRCFRWKKSVLVFSTAFMLAAAGIAGGPAVTAWATPTSGTAAGDDVRVRETAVSGDLIGSLSDGQEVAILDEMTGSDGMTWYQVTYQVDGSSRIGWVRSDLLNTSDEDAGDTEVTEGTVEDTESSYVVAESVPESVIPEGFSVTAVTYQEEEVQALYSDVLDLYLLYAVNADDESDTGLFVCDLQYETMYPFIQFELAEDSVILIEIPDEEQQLVSDRFVRTEYTTAHGGITAYQIAEPDELVAEDAAIVDYYYLYGINGIGETGWYLYNADEGTIQKNVTNMQYSVSTAETEETEAAAVDNMFVDSDRVMTRLIVCVIALICLILLVIAILFSVRYRRLRRILEDGTEDGAGSVAGSEPGENRTSRGEKHEEKKSSDVPEKERHEEKRSSDSSHRKKSGERKSTDFSRREKTEHSRRDSTSSTQDRPGREADVHDDMDVIDLDDMGDEDYEAMLNKYLSENFPSEEDTEQAESIVPDPELSKRSESQTNVSGADESQRNPEASSPTKPQTESVSRKKTEPKTTAPDESGSDSVGTDAPGRSTSVDVDSEFELPGLSRSGKESAEDDAFDYVIGRMENLRSSTKENTGDDETDKSLRRHIDE
ncbi:MAG: SH3 domain-containing protein [Clostridiales bacterium]|nr:SH3 domain-containing protein [Clostridiales bacterium]